MHLEVVSGNCGGFLWMTVPLAADIVTLPWKHLEVFSSSGFCAGIVLDTDPLICHSCVLQGNLS